MCGPPASGPNAKLEDLDLPLTERDGVVVDERLRVVDRPEVWAIGDSAAIPQVLGGLAPPTAQAAVQEGRVAARNVLAAIDGRQEDRSGSSTGPWACSWSSAAASPSTT